MARQVRKKRGKEVLITKHQEQKDALYVMEVVAYLIMVKDALYVMEVALQVSIITKKDI